MAIMITISHAVILKKCNIMTPPRSKPIMSLLGH